MTTDGVNRQVVESVAYLASCAVRQVAPSVDYLRTVDLELVYHEAQRQLLAGCCAFALESAGMCTEDFMRAKARAVRKAVLMDQQREGVLDRLEEAGIWYLPLKGAMLKDWYPSIGMREMSDNDILFDASRADDVRAIMLDLGFEGKHFGGGVHDCYYKKPVYNFEMHRALFDGVLAERLNAYYADIPERLIRDEGRRYGYHFSPEDFYLYTVAHEYKHYLNNGTGLRGCLDTYILLSKLTLDMGCVVGEAKRMGIEEFERTNRMLALHLVSGETLAGEELRMLEYMQGSGVYGSLAARVDHGVEAGGGGMRGMASYVLSRVFLRRDQIRDWYPFFYRHKALWPLVPIVRLGKAITASRRKVLEEIRALYRS